MSTETLHNTLRIRERGLTVKTALQPVVEEASAITGLLCHNGVLSARALEEEKHATFLPRAFLLDAAVEIQ